MAKQRTPKKMIDHQMLHCKAIDHPNIKIDKGMRINPDGQRLGTSRSSGTAFPPRLSFDLFKKKSDIRPPTNAPIT
jgi:hypothetical protein